MGRRSRRGIMSEELKYELAKDLGFYDTVQRDGWGGIRAKDAGNMVKRAIQIAEQKLAAQPVQTQQFHSAPPQSGAYAPAGRAQAAYVETPPSGAYAAARTQATYAPYGETQTPGTVAAAGGRPAPLQPPASIVPQGYGYAGAQPGFTPVLPGYGTAAAASSALLRQ